MRVSLVLLSVFLDFRVCCLPPVAKIYGLSHFFCISKFPNDPPPHPHTHTYKISGNSETGVTHFFITPCACSTEGVFKTFVLFEAVFWTARVVRPFDKIHASCSHANAEQFIWGISTIKKPPTSRGGGPTDAKSGQKPKVLIEKW